MTDHAFYLFDDTDEVTRSLCGLSCGYGPEDHITRDEELARERIRDAAPLLLEALKELAGEGHCWCPWRQEANQFHLPGCLKARIALNAARQPAAGGAGS